MNKAVKWSCVVAILLASSAARAETWPSHLIKAVIPFGAGSAADVVPRLVFDRLAIELGQPIVIENRVGAGGTLGTSAVASSNDSRVFGVVASHFIYGRAVFAYWPVDHFGSLSTTEANTK